MSLNSGSGSSLPLSSSRRVKARTLSLRTSTAGGQGAPGRPTCACFLPVAGPGLQRPVAEAAVAVAQVELIVVVTVAGPAQPVAAGSQVHLHHLLDETAPSQGGGGSEGRRVPHLAGGGVLGAAAAEVGRLVGSHRGVAEVVPVGGQRVALFGLPRLLGCGSRRLLKHCWPPPELGFRLPSDSATTMVKNPTAPLTSLNQEQLNRNRMEDEVTLDDLWLTCTPGGGTGGPADTHTHTHTDQSEQPEKGQRGLFQGSALSAFP